MSYANARKQLIELQEKTTDIEDAIRELKSTTEQLGTSLGQRDMLYALEQARDGIDLVNAMRWDDEILTFKWQSKKTIIGKTR